eukprot:1141734-Pelagomonas_calceolata.AAC.5
MYRMYANIVHSLVTGWCTISRKIPDTQFGFYLGRNTLQPIYSLWYLQHAAIYVNDIDELAEGVQGAVTGTDGARMTHMLYADDLTLTANDQSALQAMLNHLDVYAQRSTY